MKARLIKLGTSLPNEEAESPMVEAPMIETIRTWIREFQSTKADRVRLDFERVNNSGKT